MKKSLSIFLSLLLLVCLSVGMLTSCQNKQGDVEADKSLVGQWILPDSVTEGTLEAYVFDKDGSTFRYYQLSQTYKILNKIDGTYEKTDTEFTITMLGYPLTYSYVISEDGKQMTMSDHGTDAICTRYTGELS